MKLRRSDYAIAIVAVIVGLRIVWELSELAYASAKGLQVVDFSTPSLWQISIAFMLASLGVSGALMFSNIDTKLSFLPQRLRDPSSYLILACLFSFISWLFLFS